MLLTLLVFHMYWWILICSMISKQLKNRGKVGEDIRSGKLLVSYNTKLLITSSRKFYFLQLKSISFNGEIHGTNLNSCDSSGRVQD